MITLIASSVLLQFIAAYLSFRMILITGKHRAWMLIAIAISIGALRRSNDLIKLLFDNGSYDTIKLVGCYRSVQSLAAF